MADTPILPQTREGLKAILDAYLLNKAIYEVNYELNNRPDWVGSPLQGILQVLETEEEPSTSDAKKEVEGESAKITDETKQKPGKLTKEAGRKTRKEG